MGEKVEIRARSTLNIPVRLTLAITQGGGDPAEILVTVSERGKSIKGVYGHNCADADLLPDKEWNDLGTLEIEARHNISISGKEVREV